MYFSFIAPFRKLHLASSALSHGSEVKFPLFCIASGLILCKNARRTRYFKSESSCNTCFGSPTYKQINTISVLFPAVQAVTISSSCNRRLLIACFPSPIGNCMQSINWRAAVCPPQRAFNWIRRPCRRHGTACRIESAKIRMPISICRSQPPQKSPQRPCAFRPATQNRPSSWFYDLQKTIAPAERGAKKVFWTGLVTNMHQKCKLQTASFVLFMFQFTFCITFFQNRCSC